MAVSINEVYQKVLVIANKEQRGYITPQEFNLFADKAQLEIYDGYFHDLKMANYKNKNQKGVGFDEVEMVYQKLAPFKNTVVISQTAGDNTFELPDRHYFINNIVNVDLGVELKELSMKKILHTESNPLTRATTNRPVYAQIGINLTTDGVNAISQVRIYPTPTVDTSLHVDFFKKPATPKWAYVVVQGKALYNASATDLQDFELHVSEEENLVTRILGLSGVAMRSPDIAQAGVMDKQSIKQSQND